MINNTNEKHNYTVKILSFHNLEMLIALRRADANL